MSFIAHLITRQVSSQPRCVGPTLNNGCPFRWPNVDIQRWHDVSMLAGQTCRHYVGPTYVKLITTLDQR